jgi:hypothetical protein
MNNVTLNFCQVSLARDIPIIQQNYKSLKKFYKYININIICPKSELEIFKKNLKFDEFSFFCEDDIITFAKFKTIYEDIKAETSFKYQIYDRLQWYYQQILKITFTIDFIKNKNNKITIWDADTIITKKIKFFDNNYSIKYGTLFEFNKKYFSTVQFILNEMPKYYISSLVQFISLTVDEGIFLLKLFKINQLKKKDLAIKISNIILNSVFKHKDYSESLFSEYELIGTSNLLNKKTKQKAIFSLRSGLNGQLTKKQYLIAKLFNVYHVTYEHAHENKNSRDMLNRHLSWFKFFKILFKFYPRFVFKNLVHNIKYYLS